MTDVELLEECKKGLNIPLTSTDFDGVLTQKILVIKGFLRNAGVSDMTMNDDLAVGVIVMGVADLWELSSGEVKLSPAFNMLLAQLAYTSYADTHVFRAIYDGNGNTGGGSPIDSKVYSQGDTVIVLDNIGLLIRTGYLFEGWNTMADGSGINYLPGSTFRIGVTDISLFAKWVVE